MSGFRGKRHVVGLLDDMCAGDQVAVKRRLTDTATITRGDGDRIATTELVAVLHGARWDGLICAGHCVVARLERAGRRFILFADIETTRIRAVRVFAEGEWT